MQITLLFGLGQLSKVTIDYTNMHKKNREIIILFLILSDLLIEKKTGMLRKPQNGHLSHLVD